MTALIEAVNLSKRFGGGGVLGLGARPVRALNDVTLAVARGEAVGLVGESGSGKSTMGRVMLGLTPASAGSVRLDGVDIATLRGKEARRLRQRMQLVFQDPYSSLDPRRRIGAQIADGLLAHDLAKPAQIADRVAALLAQVGLPTAHADRYPHEFSGGQRQRIGIARALAVGPEFLVADEPVSALDVSVQAQVLTLLADLRARLGLAMLFISHDLPVVRSLCDRVVVLYLGRVMEEGPAAAVFEHPRHPYTRALLSAAPNIDPARRRRRILLRGDPPSPANPPSGCVFRTRCAWAVEACAATIPALAAAGPQHRVACLRAEDAALRADPDTDGPV